MTQSLAQKFDALSDLGALNKEVPEYVKDNLASHILLRPYQNKALERFLYFMEDYPQRPNPIHLLFHMATGSGKTVLMAALIIDLYKRGYRNFLFFVNSSQIIEKTKDNFLNPSSNKFLFGDQIRIDDKLVDVRAVGNFESVSASTINIHFTTIQGLHSRMNDPRENAVTTEDFADAKTVLISDEAHHLNAETKKTLNKGEAEAKKSWESTVSSIFEQHSENILLEFTATVDMSHEAIREKYRDKILYDYALKQFREDGYSKDIELRQADLPPKERMFQAMVLSQYRRKVAEAHGIQCKPVILMKSKTIAESGGNEESFSSLVEEINGDTLVELRERSNGDVMLSSAFTYILDDCKITPDDFARELTIDFAIEKTANVNKPDDLAKLQIQLNTLEDLDNELRVIFAVDKLNEGWDVLNLFDIVRLYDTRDGKGNKVGKTTMQEAQLIGRGARYFPFIAPDQIDAAKEKRKYDKQIGHPLRVLEQLHYHCSHNPRYIQDIRNALRETGMLDETARTVTVRVKDSFKETNFYQSEFIWVNERKKDTRDGMLELGDYLPDVQFTYPTLMTGRVTESSAFGGGGLNLTPPNNEEPTTRHFKLSEFNLGILRFAADSNDFFHFQGLRRYFPKLTTLSEFLTSKKFLGGVSVAVRGLPSDLRDLSAVQKLNIVQYTLHQIKSRILSESVEYIGTKEFKPKPVKEIIADKTMKLRVEGETGLSWKNSNIPGLDQIDLSTKDWHVYDDSYGTDQEKHFIRYIHDNADKLMKRYEAFYLVRNEKAFKLYSFSSGQAFEPDFILFLREKGKEKDNIFQLFVEPKGDHLKLIDKWKDEFLKDIHQKAEIHTVFKGRDYSVYGLPFFNSEGQGFLDFQKAFSGFSESEQL